MSMRAYQIKIGLAAGLLALSACIVLTPSRPGAQVERPLPAAPTSPTEPTLPAAAGRPTGAMRQGTLNVAFRCAGHDERHHTTQADVEVRDGNVQYLRARLATPSGGSCEFAFPDFSQTKRTPNVELRANNGRCVLRLWEQGPKVTLAFSDCQQFCRPSQTFDEILPVMYDRRVDRCD
ncbi:MAG: hypothetical protein FWD62_06965 [Betaproteobacteria bacterium]|nr:hypothetical protein [Betaproteobacteria bacterium]